jgi:hypothetical protein
MTGDSEVRYVGTTPLTREGKIEQVAFKGDRSLLIFTINIIKIFKLLNTGIL